MSEANQWILGMLPHWLQWLSFLLWLLFIISFLLLFIFTYTTVANLVAAPFNSLLAEKVALHLTGQPLNNSSFSESLRDLPRALWRQICLLGYYLPRALGLGILFFIPIVQLAAAPLWFIFNAWFMTLQYIDYPTDSQKFPYTGSVRN